MDYDHVFEYTMNLQILNPLRFPGWDELLLANPNASFFHSSQWAKVLHESYGYEPRYFASIEKGEIKVLLPLMQVRSAFTGNRGVSLPFTDYCEPILPDTANLDGVLKAVIRHGFTARWDSMELRSGSSVLSGFTPSSVYYRHTLDLSKGEEALMAGLRDSTRRSIRKSAKEGTEVTIHTSKDAVREFYRLNCLTRKLHGLPPQPYSFFEKIQELALAEGSGIVALASHQGRIIAGGFFLHFGDKAIYKYGASDRRHQHLRANNLVMWQMIKWYAQNGFRTFCFGKTEPDNEGLLQFKRGWGAKEEELSYYKYDLNRSVFVRESSKVKGFHNRIFRSMPVPLLHFTGALLYRHMG